jgi:hypothetical protein
MAMRDGTKFWWVIGAKEQIFVVYQQAAFREMCSTLGMAKCCKHTARAPHCFACRIERVTIALKPIARRYDVRSVECPSCKSVLRLVEARISVTSPLRRNRRRLLANLTLSHG